MSSSAIADSSMMEQWRGIAGSHSFSDERYQQMYSPAQRQAFIDQRNAEIAHRQNAELAKQIAHANEMQQYYASERASRQFITETRRFNAPPTPPILAQPQLGQYYPESNYYGNSGTQLRYSPAQTQGLINQFNIDRARQAQAAQEQYEINYERWRQDQNSRRDSEGFASYDNNTSSGCDIKPVMTDDELRRCDNAKK
jgi:hypothetical protein